MTDETLLDQPAELTRADTGGLLRAVASAGAHVRTAARAALGSDLLELRPDGRPRTVMLAGPGPSIPLAAGLLRALTDDAVPVTRLRPTGALAAPGALTWTLPRWAGPLDLLLITSAEGTEPGLSLLLEAAYRRGCALATVAPAGSALAEATAHRRCLTLPLATSPHHEPLSHAAAPGPAWAHLTPLLLLGDRLGLFPSGTADPEAVHLMADRLDTTAERCGPAAKTAGNPAKTLAAELSPALPLLWSEGLLARAVARHAAATLAALSGSPALAAELPEALTAHDALLDGTYQPGTPPADIFRDRVDEPLPLRPRLLLLHSPLTHPDGPAASAAAAARDLASAHGVPFSELAVDGPGGTLPAAAELLAQLDFTAVYLALLAGAGA